VDELTDGRREPAMPSGVEERRQDSAEAVPGRENGSRPPMRIVGDPANPNRSASSMVSTSRVITRT